MKRTKTPARSSTPGPASGCTSEVIQQAHRLCLLGLTNRELATAFGVHKDTIGHWYRTKPRFQQAVDEGRKHADANVAEALYKRATGYSVPDTKFYKDRVTEKEYDDDGNLVSERTYSRIIEKPYMKKIEPNVKAAIKWLGVRNRETWGESYKVEHEHSHLLAGEININHMIEQISDKEVFTDEELEVAAKLGLQKAAKKLVAPN